MESPQHYSISILIFTLNRWFNKIYPAKRQINKANASDNETVFLDLNLSIHNDTVSTKYMINGMILILILLIYRSLMAKSLCVPFMVYIYILYKKKRKPYTMFNNSSHFKYEHFKLAGYLDCIVSYQPVEFHIFSGTKTSCFLSSWKGTHKTKSHKHNT